MKKFFSALGLCTLLLAGGSAFLMERAAAAEDDVVMKLLNLPAPPPPNPLVSISGIPRDQDFYNKNNPPKDDAPIEDLIDYWSVISAGYSELRHMAMPSPRVATRLMAEIRSNPTEAVRLVNLYRDNPEGTELIKDIYDRSLADNSLEKSERVALKTWLMENSPYFAGDLERQASKVRDANNYVSGHDSLLALTKHDWDRAEPIVNRLYSDQSQPVSRIAATWALYRRALQGSSISDADRYRDELKAMVENRSATYQMRDLALDALVVEKEWPGRDEWYFSLLADETLADMGTYTGLTTIILNSPVEKYKDKMIELVRSENPWVRGAAIRNLATLLTRSPDIEIIRALLPWLSDAKWSPGPENGTRSTLVRELANVKLPDSVPGLIQIMNEKPSREEQEERRRMIEEIDGAVNAMSNSSNTSFTTRDFTTNSMVTTRIPFGSSSNSNTVSIPVPTPGIPSPSSVRLPVNTTTNSGSYAEDFFPFRYSALSALEKQADIRAVPALRRLLGRTSDWEQGMIVKAIIASGGFTIQEMVDGIEAAAKANEDGDVSISAGHAGNRMNGPAPLFGSNSDIRVTIGMGALQLESPSDDLVRGVVDRIESLERRDAKTAKTMRAMLINWKGVAVYAMLLRDVKNDKTNENALLKLLSSRKEIRDKQPNDIYDLRTGSAIGIGLAGCMLEDVNDMSSLLSAENAEATVAMFACARLVRASLPLDRVTPLLRSQNRRLALAAERFIETEDSVEARNAFLALHPNAAKITGATTRFGGKPGEYEMDDKILEVFKSVSPFYASAQYAAAAVYEGDFSAVEKKLQEEVIENGELLGVYNYENFYVRIYADRVAFCVQEDDARYRERLLNKEEFDYLKNYLEYHRVNELPPFLSCSGGCEPRQLLMLGRNGGRRVFVKASKMPEFFLGLDSYFADMARGKLALKYEVSKEIPGLEVLWADDDLAVETVWKRGDDTRLFVTNRKVREKVNKEIDNVIDESGDNEAEESVDEDGQPKEVVEPWQKQRDLKAKRAYEGIGWLGFGNGNLTGAIAAPGEIMLPPMPDAQTVAPEFERWKALTGSVEVRTDEQGIYKIVGGRMTKMQSGYYEFPVVSDNGRWVLATKRDDEYGPRLVRINLQTGRETLVNPLQTFADQAIVYLPAVNRYLVGSEDYGDYDHEYESEETTDDGFARPAFSKGSLVLVNPDNGIAQPAPGELEPLLHQTFRKLQTTGKPTEFWAAIPDDAKNETVVGVYNAAVFGFKPVMKLPKIYFDSLDMWVDAGKLYFVYKGHLLSVPLPAK